MKPETIIQEAAADGVSLSLSDTGTIKVNGEQVGVNRWLAVIRENKPGILAALRSFRLVVDDLEALPQSCADCRHLATLHGHAKPGYCGGRDDLPHAYSEGHPLRLLPGDGGAGCGAFLHYNSENTRKIVRE